MILPSKHLSQERALLTVGGVILKQLSLPLTVSALWELITADDASQTSARRLRFDGFILALDLLFLMDAIEYREGLIIRRAS